MDDEQHTLEQHQIITQEQRQIPTGIAAVLAHFHALGIPPAQLHLAMGAMLYSSLSRGAPTTATTSITPNDAWSQPNIQRIVQHMEGVEGVDAAGVRAHVLRTLGNGAGDDATQALVQEAMHAAQGDVGAVLASLQRYYLGWWGGVGLRGV